MHDDPSSTDTSLLATEIRRVLETRAFLPTSKPKVLLLEDEETLAENFCHWAKELSGFEVLPFRDGDEANDYAKHESIAAAVLDCRVPGRHSGVSVGKTVNGRDPSVPVLMTTAFSDDFEDEAKEVGLVVKDWIAKPYGETKLVVRKTEQRIWEALPEAIARGIGPALLKVFRKNVFAVDKGTVTEVAGDWSRIRFNEGDLLLHQDFPTWRLRAANADEVGAQVEHRMSQFIDLVVSQLVRLDGRIHSLLTEPQQRQLTDEDLRRLHGPTHEEQ